MALDIASKIIDSIVTNSKQYLISGQSYLLNYLKDLDLVRIQDLFEVLTQKREILTLLNQSLEAPGLQIFIGKESGYDALSDCSVVSKSYSINGGVVGSVGVIGPTRMPYDRVIPAVEMTAQLLSAALNQS